MPAAPVHHTAVDKSHSWDGAAAEKAFDKKANDLVKFYAWVDTGEVDSDADGTDKEDGWGPHHDVDSSGVPGAANLQGVEAAMAALNGAHGASLTIPDGDKQGVWEHLAAHYEDAGIAKDAIPELKRSKRRSRTLAERRRAHHRKAGSVRRTFTFDPSTLDRSTGPSLRAAMAQGDSSSIAQLVGYAIRFGATYEVWDPWGSFYETMTMGCCTQTVSEGDEVKFLYDHEGLPMASTGAGTLVLTQDAQGLAITANIDTRQSLANDLLIAIERRDVTQMSIGFECISDQWSPDGMSRTIYAIRLFDVSAVAFPASPTTSIQTNATQRGAAALTRARSAIKAFREGKVLSQANSDRLGEGQAALDAVHAADDTWLADLGEWFTSLGQSFDPDVMAQVAGWLQAIDAALDEAQQAFADVLGTADPDDDQDSGGIEEPSSDAGEETNEDDDSEAEYQGDPDGTLVGSPGASDVSGNLDGSGSRSRQRALLELERERLSLARH